MHFCKYYAPCEMSRQILNQIITQQNKQEKCINGKFKIEKQIGKS